MKSTAQVGGHPVHPMLIAYPLALLSSAVAYDVAAAITGKMEWARTAARLTDTGLGAGLAAAVPGVLDYFGTVPPGTNARRTATQHAISNVAALGCFALARSGRNVDGRLPPTGLALELVGMGLLSLGGWLGGELVYHERIGVVDAPLPEATARRALR